MIKLYIVKIIILCFLCLQSFSALAFELVVAYSVDEHKPFVMGDSAAIPKNKPGISIEMVLMLEDRVEGLEIRFTRLPWKRCVKYLSLNKVDAIFSASFKKKRLKIGWYPTTDGTHEGPVDRSRRFNTFAYSLFKLKGSKISWDGKQFTNVIPNYNFGAPAGTSIVGEMEKRGLRIETCNDQICSFRKLVGKRIQGAFLLNVTGNALLKKQAFATIEKVNPSIVEKDYYLMISDGFVKQNPQMAQKIWDAIGVIRETYLAEIAARYVSTN